MNTTAEIIKSWRWRMVRAGFTQRTFAAQVGVKASHISMILAFKKNPSLPLFDRIEGFLKECEESHPV